MRHTYQRQKVAVDPFYGRLSFLGLAMIIVMGGMLVRLYSRSIISHSVVLAKAEQQYTVRQALNPHRGSIYASDTQAELENGKADQTTWKPLATNNKTFALSVVPRNLKDKRVAAEQLSKWAKISSDDLFSKINNDKLYLPPIVHGLSEDDTNAIVALKLPGVYLTEEDTRYYPEGSLASQIIGFLNGESKGNYGIEQKYDDDLKGSGGEIIGERDVTGKILSLQDNVPVRDGSNVVLTIDANVQKFVETSLKNAISTYQADSGTIVVENVKTGEIVAMASSPDYSPQDYRSVPQDKQSVFSNPAVNDVWEPGSIFKTLVMGAALDAGLVEPDTTGDFGSSVQVGSATIHTAENKAFGHETMTQVLENSDNVAMVWIADKLGNEKMYEALKKFGIGQKTGIDLPAESAGAYMPLKNWRDVNRATMSFGQGVSTTPVQIVSAMSAIANAGTMMQVHVVKQIIGADGQIIADVKPTVKEEHVISAAAAKKLNDMMVSVCENGHGKRARVQGYWIAGKTGTAQIADPNGGYLEDAHIGGFGGFFPADNPQFAMIVKLDRPKTVNFAESSAAPTFGEVAQFILNYYRIPPTR